MPLQTGQVLQRRYHIIRLLGQGGMGSVYLAKDLRLQERRCAIKEQIPDPNVTQKALTQLRQQFHIEARTLAKLDHANLPKVSDYFSYAGNEYLVMDYIEGKDLENALQKFAGPLPERAMLEWGIQVLNALEHLHKQNPPIIHRDIKPANIILTRQGEVKLVDFGLVKLLDPSNPRTVTIMRGMGTPEYTPLEQYASNSSHTDGRTDIYAFAATLYHLLTGVAPPDAPQRVIDPTLLVPPRQHNPALSKKTEEIILKGMSIAAEERFQSAKLLRDALQKQLERLNTPPTDPTQNVVRRRTALGRRRQSQMGSKIMTATLALSFFGLLFWLGTSLHNSFSDMTVSQSTTSTSIVTETVDSSVMIEPSQTPNSADFPVAVKFPDTATPIPTQTVRPIPSNTIVVPIIPPASSTPLPIRASNTPFLPTSTPYPTAKQTTPTPTPVSPTSTVTLEPLNQEATATPTSSVTEEEDQINALATENEIVTSPTPIPVTLVPTAANPTATFPAAAVAVSSEPIVNLDANLRQLGVTVSPATVLPGQSYWRVKEVTVEFEPDPPAIQVDVLDKEGQRLTGQQVSFVWGSNSQQVGVDSAGYSAYGIDFTMPATDQSVTVKVAGQPSEMVQGLQSQEVTSGENTSNNSIYFLIFEEVTP